MEPVGTGKRNINSVNIHPYPHRIPIFLLSFLLFFVHLHLHNNKKGKKKKKDNFFFFFDGRKIGNKGLAYDKSKAYGTWSSRVIPHPSTNQAYERLRSEFGMGSPACATSMAVYN